MSAATGMTRLREIADQRGWVQALAAGCTHVVRQAARSVAYIRRDFIIVKSLDGIEEADCDADVEVRVVGPEMHEAALAAAGESEYSGMRAERRS